MGVSISLATSRITQRYFMAGQKLFLEGVCIWGSVCVFCKRNKFGVWLPITKEYTNGQPHHFPEAGPRLWKNNYFLLLQFGPQVELSGSAKQNEKLPKHPLLFLFLFLFSFIFNSHSLHSIHLNCNKSHSTITIIAA
jgi:hypothetical protein